MRWITIGILTSYFLGSIPTAYIFGRVLKGVDIRKFGSGNVGATNALRVLGFGPGVIVLLLDVLKGLIPVVFVSDFVLLHEGRIPAELLRIALGIFCVMGHNWTCFLRFQGGKGVASTFGVLIGLALRVPHFGFVLFTVIAVWCIVFLLSRIVSLSSILAGLSFPITMLVFHYSKSLVIFSCFVAFFMVLRHKDNIKRLLQGKESRLSFKKSPHP